MWSPDPANHTTKMSASGKKYQPCQDYQGYSLLDNENLPAIGEKQVKIEKQIIP
jgi:hypothetical protein